MAKWTACQLGMEFLDAVSKNRIPEPDHYEEDGGTRIWDAASELPSRSLPSWDGKARDTHTLGITLYEYEHKKPSLVQNRSSSQAVLIKWGWGAGGKHVTHHSTGGQTSGCFLLGFCFHVLRTE